MEKQDRIFDGLAKRFSQRIYDSPKGKIRLAIVQDDLQNTIDLTKPLKVLDMGGGLGQMSIWLAQQGHQITLCEPAIDMLDVARESISTLALSDKIQLSDKTLQHLSTEQTEQYDLIIFHAVLEWLAEPKQAIALLLTLLKPNAVLSMMFYNHHSAVMRSLMVGDFKRIRNNYIAAIGDKGFTPISPLEPDQVIQWLGEFNMNVLNWTGVRAFHDYMHPEARKKAKLEDVLDMERKYSRIEPWRSLARYQHVVCQQQEAKIDTTE